MNKCLIMAVGLLLSGPVFAQEVAADAKQETTVLVEQKPDVTEAATVVNPAEVKPAVPATPAPAIKKAEVVAPEAVVAPEEMVSLEQASEEFNLADLTPEQLEQLEQAIRATLTPEELAAFEAEIAAQEAIIAQAQNDTK